MLPTSFPKFDPIANPSTTLARSLKTRHRKSFGIARKLYLPSHMILPMAGISSRPKN